jgi:hypothetical protein
MAVLSQGIRQTLLLVTDDIDREETLTDGQRKAFRRITDAAVTMMAEELTKRFEKYYADRDDDRTAPVQPVGDSSRKRRRVPEAEEDEEVDI